MFALSGELCVCGCVCECVCVVCAVVRNQTTFFEGGDIFKFNTQCPNMR